MNYCISSLTPHRDVVKFGYGGLFSINGDKKM